MAATVDAPIHQREALARPSRWWLWLTLAAAPLFAVGLWATWEFTVDDAYITWRYSQNWADGHGPVWNVGGDPVEGFTNFAWMAWHAAAAAVGLNVATVAKVTSAALGLAVLILLARTPGTRIGAAIAVAAFLLFLPTYFHTTGGLETAAFAAVLLRAVVVAVHALRGDPTRGWEIPALVLLGGTLRPDGVAAAAPALLVWLWLNRRRPAAWAWTAAAGAAGAGYFAWRWSFYGQLLPNTFYVKFGDTAAGTAWLEVTVAALLPLIVLTGSLVLRSDTTAVGLLLTATVGAAWSVYVLSGPSMDYVHRFAFHAFPVLCLGAGLALGDVRRRVAVLVGAAAVGWVALAGVAADDLPVVANYGPDLARAHVAIGQGLAAADVPAGERTLATSDAGAIPYFSGWKTLDYIGLNDEQLARGDDVDTRFAEFDATAVVVTSNRPTPLPTAYGLDLAPALAGYEQVAAVHMRDDYYQLLFVKPAYAGAVRAVVQPAVDAAQAANDPGRYDLTVDRWMKRLLGH